LQTLFDVGELRLVPGLSRDIAQTMTGWAPIPGVT
jgi:type II secretory pathway component PulK